MNRKKMAVIMLVAGFYCAGLVFGADAPVKSAGKAKSSKKAVPAVAVSTAQVVPLAPVPAPKIRIDSDVWDFGNIPQGNKVSHLYRISNNGDADLVISRVRSTCGCTVAEISTKTVSPGGETSVEVTFDSKYYTGVIEKSLYVESNDPVNPNVMLLVYGMVEAPLVNLDMTLMSRPYIQGGSPDSQRIMINNRGYNEIKINKITSSSKRYRVVLVTDSVAPGDYIFSTINVEPDKKKKKPGAPPRKENIYIEIAIPIEEIQ